jgi:acyl CoA:acetate/3-ketoacid CoA transferase alpha subunit
MQSHLRDHIRRERFYRDTEINVWETKHGFYAEEKGAGASGLWAVRSGLTLTGTVRSTN